MNVFCKRLKSLRNAAKLNQTELGEKLNCQRTRIADLERGKSTPTIEDITILCKTFNVSSDYLLGISDIATTDVELKAICEYTGLSEDALIVLKYLTKDTEYKDLINFIIPHNNFAYALLEFSLYAKGMNAAINSQESHKEGIVFQETHKGYFTADKCYEEARYHFFETIETLKALIESYNNYQNKYFENRKEAFSEYEGITIRDKGSTILEIAKDEQFSEE